MTADEKRKSLVTITFVVVILFLGLRPVSEENNYHFFRVKNDTLNLYAFPIGIRQISYANGFAGPVTYYEWGFSNLFGIVPYKYYFVSVSMLLGVISVMAVKERVRRS